MESRISRLEVALALREIGQLLSVLGGNPFRARAFVKGASALERLDADLSRIVEEGRLTEIPDIGAAIAAQIVELAETERSSSPNGRRSPACRRP